jgi:hypothetical protein
MAVGDGYTELGQLEVDTQSWGTWSWIHRTRAVADGYTELGQLEMDKQS